MTAKERALLALLLLILVVGAGVSQSDIPLELMS